jgi:hypothetical protein
MDRAPRLGRRWGNLGGLCRDPDRAILAGMRLSMVE